MIGAQVLTPQTMTLAWLLYMPVLGWAVWRSPWVELFADRRRQHLLLGTAFALFILWLVRRDFDTGVSYHFIGMTAVTLLLDWPLAMVGGLIISALVVFSPLWLETFNRTRYLSWPVGPALAVRGPVPFLWSGMPPSRLKPVLRGNASQLRICVN